jgi:DNA replication protein DnaC
MNKSDLNLDEVFKRLHLANARRNWRALCDQAERESWSYRDLLAMLAAEEVSQRQQTRLQRLARKARFPFLKTIDEFNFTFQSTVKLPLIGSYLSPDFVSDGRCLVLTGKPGRGKTHLAIAIAYRAIQNGFDALFTTAAALIDDLSAAGTKSQFREALRTYTAPDVLVIDEVGYLTYGPDAANVLFHVVNERHQKRRPMIFTTNKDLTAWGKVLHDVDLAEAIVDRILERGRLLKLDGPSIRTKDLGLDSTQDQQLTNTPARISGINPAEYLEPTAIPENQPIIKGKSSKKALLAKEKTKTSKKRPEGVTDNERRPTNVAWILRFFLSAGFLVAFPK